MRLHRLDTRTDRIKIGHIHGNSHAVFAERVCRPNRFCFQQIRHCNPGTFAGIGLADGTPDTAGATGYESDLSIKPFHVMHWPLSSNRCRWPKSGVR